MKSPKPPIPDYFTDVTPEQARVFVTEESDWVANGLLDPTTLKSAVPVGKPMRHYGAITEWLLTSGHQ